MDDAEELQIKVSSEAKEANGQLPFELPEEQLRLAVDAAEEQLAAEVEAEAQLPLPQFNPPVNGLRVTSEQTGNTYTITESIGEGQFGTVYSCTDVWRNELAAKVFKPRGTYDEVRATAVLEVQKLLELRHPFITHVHDAFELEHTFYIVTEKCLTTIQTLLNIDGFKGDKWVLPMARCLLQAVQYLHNRGYAHQDIHVGNVFTAFHRDEFASYSEQALTFKLGDLGIAKLVQDIDGENTMLNGSILPPEYLDPKQFGALDHRIDIYHCGLLFLQLMLDKELSFTQEEILNGLPRQMAEALPFPFGQAIAKALRRHPSSRTPSAMQLWEDLIQEPSRATA